MFNIKAIKGLRAGVACYAAQAIPQINADIGQKDHLWMETNWNAWMFTLLADAVLVLHLGFVIFVTFGGLWVWQKNHVAWFHLPAVVWGVMVESMGWICPLTPLENWLRTQGNGVTGNAGFMEHYLQPLLYPAGLTREIQWALAAALLIINVICYAAAYRRRRLGRQRHREV